MSKSDKLARLKSSVKESTGLTYNTSGNVIELNFTPNVTAPGVSVPLVVAGNTQGTFGTCPATSAPISAIPYAVIEDHKPSNVNGGNFYNYADSSQLGFLMGSRYFRTRDLNTRVFDAIGVSINPQISSTTDGGPGNSFSLPIGTYRICATTTVFRAASIQTILCELGNSTSPKLIGNSTYTQPFNFGTGDTHDTNLPGVKGIFTVSSEKERYAIAQVSHYDSLFYGFGVKVEPASDFDNVYTQVELWKLN